MWREIAFCALVVRVESHGGTLYFEDGDYDRDVGYGPFYDFPAHLVPETRDRNALLSYCGCVQAQQFFVNVGQKLLRGRSS